MLLVDREYRCQFRNTLQTHTSMRAAGTKAMADSTMTTISAMPSLHRLTSQVDRSTSPDAYRPIMTPARGRKGGHMKEMMNMRKENEKVNGEEEGSETRKRGREWRRGRGREKITGKSEERGDERAESREMRLQQAQRSRS